MTTAQEMASKSPAGKQLLIIATSLLFTFGCGSSSSDNDINYAAIGASDAAGIGAEPITNGYVYLIEDGLDQNCGDTGLTNLGIPGLNADEIQDTEIPVAAEINPDLITVFTGGNDLVSGRMPEEFEADLAEILSQLRSDTPAKIFVANLPDMTRLPEFQQDPDQDVTAERVAAFNAAIVRQTNTAGAALIDLFSQPVQANYVAGDGFHPSNDGHRAIADLFLSQIVPQVCPAGTPGD